MVTSPGLDDKVGLWTVLETLRLLHDRPLQAAVFFVSTVQEEIGLRGATTSSYGIQPHVGIAVDVCHATDTPGQDKKQLGDTRLGNGPVLFRGPNINPHVHDRLVAAAKRHEIPAQVRGVPRGDRGTYRQRDSKLVIRDGVAVQVASAFRIAICTAVRWRSVIWRISDRAFARSRRGLPRP